MQVIGINHFHQVNNYYNTVTLDLSKCKVPEVPYISRLSTYRKRRKKPKKNTQVLCNTLPPKYIAPEKSLLDQIAASHRIAIAQHELDFFQPKQSRINISVTDQDRIKEEQVQVDNVSCNGFVTDQDCCKNDAEPIKPTRKIQHYDSIEGKMIENKQNQEVYLQHEQKLYVLPSNSRFCLCDIFQVDPRMLLKDQQSYKLIVLDPPWENKSVARGHQYATLHYKSLSRISIPDIAHPSGCFVAVWVTNNPLFVNYVQTQLFQQWNCQYICTNYWIKIAANGELITPLSSVHRLPYEQLVVGFYQEKKLAQISTQFNHELTPQPKQHEPKQPKLSKQPEQQQPQHMFISIPLRHSWKPPIDFMFPNHKNENKLEIFARELRPGWTCIGNETIKFQETTYFK